MSLPRAVSDAEDAWGRDPRVRELRRMFAAMEAGERAALERLGIDPLDPRLRTWRAEARSRCEALWAQTAHRGGGEDAAEMAKGYVACLEQAIGDRGGST